MNFEKLAYIAGPISKGPLDENVRQACEAGNRLMQARVAVIVPHLTVYQGQVYHEGTIAAIPEVLPKGTVHEDWYGMDLIIVAQCHVLLRLPGESRGADLEVACAHAHGIPVFYQVEQVIEWANAQRGLRGLPEDREGLLREIIAAREEIYEISAGLCQKGVEAVSDMLSKKIDALEARLRQFPPTV